MSSCRSASARCDSTSRRRAASSVAPLGERTSTTLPASSSSRPCSTRSLRAAETRSTPAPCASAPVLQTRSELRSKRCGPCSRPPSSSTTCSARARSIRLAARGALDDDEIALLARPRSAQVDDVVWTDADVPLLDEALELLGPKPARAGVEAEEIRTYGHIVVDEAQDLTPMALRMLTRRSLNGSMTVVGDLAQATGALAPDSWDEVLAHLPTRKAARVHELTIGYRIPAQSMALAARVLSIAAPGLVPPRSVREGDVAPAIRRIAPAELSSEVASTVESLLAALGDGSVAVVTPGSQADEIATALESRGACRRSCRSPSARGPGDGRARRPREGPRARRGRRRRTRSHRRRGAPGPARALCRARRVRRSAW